MDPLALAAIVGLVFAGQRFSESEPAPATTVPIMTTPSSGDAKGCRFGSRCSWNAG